MGRIENTFEWCLRQGETGAKHKGLKKTGRSMQEGIENAKSTREEMQYGSETSMEEERCRRLMDNARRFVDRIKELLEETE